MSGGAGAGAEGVPCTVRFNIQKGVGLEGGLLSEVQCLEGIKARVRGSLDSKNQCREGTGTRIR